jgi:hypothetical protein
MERERERERERDAERSANVRETADIGRTHPRGEWRVWRGWRVSDPPDHADNVAL